MTAETPVTAPNAAESRPLVEMRNIHVSFGGVHAVDDVTIDLYPGEVVGLVGGNGAGKSTLIRTLSGAHPADSGEILIDGQPTGDRQPARRQGVQHRVHLPDARAGRQHRRARQRVPRSRDGEPGGATLDDGAMEDATRKVMGRLNPNFTRFTHAGEVALRRPAPGGRHRPGGPLQRRILIMDEPTAALGPAETAQVRDLIRQLKNEGIGIFLISHDIHDVFDLSDRISVMYHGRLVDTVTQGRRHDRRRAGHDHPGQEARRGDQGGARRAARLSLSSAAASRGRLGARAGYSARYASRRLRVHRCVRPRLGDRRELAPPSLRPPRPCRTSRPRPRRAGRRRTRRPPSVLTVAISAPRTSARIWRQTSLAMPPPDARIWVGVAMPVATIWSRPSRSPNATPSSTARARWRRSWLTVRPTNAPRASGSGCGLRSPVR